ncbi:UDP-2,4-diacetamido-2,4,6-trideoxy-beta-L-altropyranose hydrolase [Pseudomonas segetis]|uniref:UDP-2,4-diacetamido-2,4,6-trideoxy-beta-L-altropyranose hydrolase n=1 Tax=Pseudomonas segetis TaxID=298908 RepID=A0A239A6Y1_9PSED|nr:UDP-2,4-diacetamido-2,4,6-trideoxy-beta-L-altropyranose hydrolase [Pseudomonas segetis]SNR90643.1 UDP-2,4-diacetamido-2,4,6-trideoxy-beta-L-altropyranose hydrolase [Pseudomonas segetis]
MKVVFRVDASLLIGSGHTMRCLTMAEALRQQGVECHFLCRNHKGHLIEQIRGAGYTVHELPVEVDVFPERDGLVHSAWLGVTQAHDVKDCQPIISALQPSWIIVDHYALDCDWEEKFQPFCQHLMVIDDLADRKHSCDLLLDQNLGRLATDYTALVPEHCTILTGPIYALLRSEFYDLREYSLKRRSQPSLKNIILNMGGVDKDNATGKVLCALEQCSLPQDCKVTVIMGAKAPWIENVQAQASSMSRLIDVKVNVSNMATLMAECDLVIGAAGSTSWERCCLGVPTLMVVLAQNQVEAAKALEAQGAAICFMLESKLVLALQNQFLNIANNYAVLTNMIECASRVTDGLGCKRVVNTLLEKF